MAEKNRFEELSAVEIQELLDNAIPNSTKRATQFGMKIFNAPRTTPLTTPGKENASALVETVETAQMPRSAAPVLVQHNQFSTFSSYSGSEDNTPQAHGAQHPQPYNFHNCNIQIYNNFGGPSSH
ncbi:hypothetical protein OS493_021762 [Desmophyllum pertusum]|uniref:Uncharacterized protein n=1 Tax=Desmophyllum pertusum TaxID=174260 RepID=A0A9W9ZZT6_9CNID|nr:hypothetical protein OS493_021762 [Desmophyllum pertusum]